MWACPYCQEAIQPTDTAEWHTCEHCGRRICVAAQQAYERGHADFLSAYEVEVAAREKKRRITPDEDVVMLRYYQRAYSALELALRSDLPEALRLPAIEMMAEITRRFLGRDMVSPLESSYWAKVMTEANVQREIGALREVLAQPKAHLWSRFRSRMRVGQLQRSLQQLKQQLDLLEKTIAFLEPPRARKVC